MKRTNNNVNDQVIKKANIEKMDNCFNCVIEPHFSSLNEIKILSDNIRIVDNYPIINFSTATDERINSFHEFNIFRERNKIITNTSKIDSNKLFNPDDYISDEYKQTKLVEINENNYNGLMFTCEVKKIYIPELVLKNIIYFTEFCDYKNIFIVCKKWNSITKTSCYRKHVLEKIYKEKLLEHKKINNRLHIDPFFLDDEIKLRIFVVNYVNSFQFNNGDIKIPKNINIKKWNKLVDLGIKTLEKYHGKTLFGVESGKGCFSGGIIYMNNDVETKRKMEISGYGVLYDLSKTIVYCGGILKGKPNGLGSIIWNSGSYFIGNFIDGSRSGKGKLYDYRNKNGYKSVYKGQWINGLIHGDVKISFGKYNYFSGNLKINNNNKRHDKINNGILYINGLKYEGDFSYKFIADGNGTLIFSDGHKYIGEMKNGFKHGMGSLYNKSGMKYFSGSFRNGIIYGEGTYTLNNKIFVGYFINNTLSINGGKIVVSDTTNIKSFGEILPIDLYLFIGIK